MILGKNIARCWKNGKSNEEEKGAVPGDSIPVE